MYKVQPVTGGNIRTLHRNLLLPLGVKLEPDYKSDDSILEEDYSSSDESLVMVDPKTKLYGRKKSLSKSSKDKSHLKVEKSKIQTKEEKHVEFESKLEISPDSKLEPDTIVSPDSDIVDLAISVEESVEKNFHPNIEDSSDKVILVHVSLPSQFLLPNIDVGQRRMALNGVHHDAGHQGQHRTLTLAQERFWWLMMTEDCCTLVRGCSHRRAFEGEVPKALLCPIRAYAPLELVHLDYTSIESMMELNKPPVVNNVLMITDHFMRYALAVVMKDQTAKTVVKVFYDCFIAVFGAPVKLLSNRGANFTSTLVEELCATFSIQKCRTTPYHTQCNGQVECFHQMLFCMIGKLAHDKKAQWEQHLPELLQAYNSTQLAVTGFSLHYLMFGKCPCLPVDYYFPMVSMFKCSHHAPTYVMEVRRCFKEAYAEAHLQTNCKAKKQNSIMTEP